MKGPIVVKIIGLSTPAPEGTVGDQLDREHGGRYLVSYDPKTEAGEKPRLVTTADRSKAKRFNSIADFHALYSEPYGIRPWDGKPNRPLTAFNVEVTEA